METWNDTIGLRLTQHFANIEENIKTQVEESLYQIVDVFGDLATYWTRVLPPERFDVTRDGFIRYRPVVTNQLVDKVQEAFRTLSGTGVIVTGPLGIGKSHSLINLVLKLQSTGKYLVTFVPDCAQWKTAKDLLEMILASFGATLEDIHMQEVQQVTGGLLHAIVEIVSDELERTERQWVFVFDHINVLFMEHRATDDAGDLPYPFYMIQHLQCPQRIISVVAAAATNEIEFIDYHRAFVESVHPPEMTERELRDVFCSKLAHANVTFNDVNEIAGGVPLYVNSYLDDPQNFLVAFSSEVADSLNEMRKTDQWSAQQLSIIHSLLRMPSETYLYDKKFLVPSVSEGGGRIYNPLLPAVAAAYHNEMWEEIMDYVQRNERQLLDRCHWGGVTDMLRRRVLKYIAIRRIMADGLVFGWLGSAVNVRPECCDLWKGSGLPSTLSTDGVWIPTAPNLRAIDFCVRAGPTLFGFRVHSSAYDVVPTDFLDLCRAADWFGNPITDVVLIYLSPNISAKTAATRRLMSAYSHVRESKRSAKIHRVALCCADVACLANMPWPK
jgi:Cdc6-like AAA superfamily ATPase